MKREDTAQNDQTAFTAATDPRLSRSLYDHYTGRTVGQVSCEEDGQDAVFKDEE